MTRGAFAVIVICLAACTDGGDGSICPSDTVTNPCTVTTLGDDGACETVSLPDETQCGDIDSCGRIPRCDAGQCRVAVASPPDQPIAFDDPELAQAVRQQAGIDYSWSLAYRDVAHLVTLDLEPNPFAGEQVRSLDGLECLGQLRSLNLRGTSIDDLGPIAALQDLRELDLSFAGSSTLAPVVELPALERLSLFRYEGSVDALDGLNTPRLVYLDLRLVTLTDDAFLGRLGALQSLALTYEDGMRADVGALANLRELRWLDMHGGLLGDARELEVLTNLRVLRAQGAGISSIGFVRDMTELRELDLNSYFGSAPNVITDLQPLARLSRLERLRLGYVGLPSVSALPASSSLQELWLAGNVVPSLSVLPSLPQVSFLRIEDAELASLDGVVQRLPRLRNLEAPHNEIVDVSPLHQHPTLENLNITYNPLDCATVAPLLEQVEVSYGTACSF